MYFASLEVTIPKFESTAYLSMHWESDFLNVQGKRKLVQGIEGKNKVFD